MLLVFLDSVGAGILNQIDYPYKEWQKIFLERFLKNHVIEMRFLI
jgi:hypothetical protein